LMLEGLCDAVTGRVGWRPRRGVQGDAAPFATCTRR
jgi:hypothetical protein